jgi:hypothetical protein
MPALSKLSNFCDDVRSSANNMIDVLASFELLVATVLISHDIYLL